VPRRWVGRKVERKVDKAVEKAVEPTWLRRWSRQCFDKAVVWAERLTRALTRSTFNFCGLKLMSNSLGIRF
jgi:hypothetical protein